MNDSDTFVFNNEFTAKYHRIKINSIQLKETIEENEKTHEAVFRDRQYQVLCLNNSSMVVTVVEVVFRW